ncbi:MAG: hypothetical protein CL942_08500 [Desulfovibrio sp.]|nr:hypothetical protein [Desulfovibrio sp.]|tara:strand:+ start:27072 stop:28250 length:1179 start_codon:yes stop_codon:yes gene_type:complete
MALLAYIDEKGFHMPTYPEVLEKRKADFRAIFGEDVYLEPDSQEGQMVAMNALVEYDCYQLAQSVFNSYSPQTAQGAGLSRQVKINGITRKDFSYSIVDLLIIGQPGTIITNGMAKDVAEQLWLLPAEVIIPLSGEITVTATAKEPGAIQAAAGEVNIIGTPTRGWQSVTNTLAATPGVDAESDGVLRGRQRVSTALPSKTVLEGMAGAVANLKDVTRFKPYENDTRVEDGNGMPPNSVTMVVEGGDATEIATAMAMKKTPGAAFVGDVSQVVPDRYGMPTVVKFYRSSDVVIAIHVTIAPRAGYVSTTGEAIQGNLAEYLNSLEIGEDVLLSKLYTPINEAEPVPGQRTFDVTALTMARINDNQAAANLAILFNEVAIGDASNVTLTVVEA